ncbi:MAG: hypothetical protein K8L99_00990 [Anaerolineae bacterium]|nr:hypothetical protein [Anaerolineae bacterium]
MRNEDMISASEISEFLYCHRAWWYRLHGAASANQPEMDRGTGAHERLGQEAGQVEQGRRLGLQLVWVALGLLVLFLIVKAMTG